MKNYYLLTILFVFLLSCLREYQEQTETQLPEVVETKMGGDGKYDLLGYAYDITGPMLENDNASDSPIIDVEKSIKENPSMIDFPTSTKSDEYLYLGATADSYLNDITTKLNLKVEIPFKVFTGTPTQVNIRLHL